jgi:hypothetical protein
MVIFHSFAKYYLAVILCQFSRTYYELYLLTRHLENHRHSVQGSLKKLVLTIFIFGDGAMSWEFISPYLSNTNERVFSQGFIKYSCMNIIEHPFH